MDGVGFIKAPEEEEEESCARRQWDLSRHRIYGKEEEEEKESCASLPAVPEDVEADDEGRGEGVDDGDARLDQEAAKPGVWLHEKEEGWMGWGGLATQSVRPAGKQSGSQSDRRPGN